MRVYKGSYRTLEEDIQEIWKLHGLKVTKESVQENTWLITAKLIKPKKTKK